MGPACFTDREQVIFSLDSVTIFKISWIHRISVILREKSIVYLGDHSDSAKAQKRSSTLALADGIYFVIQPATKPLITLYINWLNDTFLFLLRISNPFQETLFQIWVLTYCKVKNRDI